jgi:soluble lytic murein transglycosylase-like protein
MFALLSTASKRTTKLKRFKQDNLVVTSREEIRKAKKRLVIVTFILTAIVASVITFFISMGMPAKMWPHQEVSLSIPASPSVKNDYVVKFESVHQTLVNLYKVPSKKADEYTTHILNHVYPDFPTAEDIMAVIQIESRWDENARSSTDARGLMQVLHGDYATNKNITQGTDILRQYYEILKNKDAAVSAYNVGIGSWKDGIRAEDYLKSYQNQVAMIKTSSRPRTMAKL